MEVICKHCGKIIKSYEDLMNLENRNMYLAERNFYIPCVRCAKENHNDENKLQ